MSRDRPVKTIAVVTFDGFNEIDSFVASHMLNRMRDSGWIAEITAPTETITSMNGVKVSAQQPLEFASSADAVLIGSGRKTRQVIEDEALLARLRLDTRKQLIGSQCSGALVLNKLGLLRNLPVFADGGTRPVLEEAGVKVLDQPFVAYGNLATAGGCLGSQYLASWVLWRLGGFETVRQALSYVAPVGEEAKTEARVRGVIEPFVTEADPQLVMRA